MVLSPVPKTLLRVGTPKNSLGGVPVALPCCLVGPRLLPREGGFVPSQAEAVLSRRDAGPRAQKLLPDVVPDHRGVNRAKTGPEETNRKPQNPRTKQT